MGRSYKLFYAFLGPIFGIIILITSIFGSYIITLFSPLIFLNQHRLWRSLMDRAISYWMLVPVTFLRLFFGITVRVTGDPIEGDKPAVIIMNHRTRIDWMFLWIAIFKINPWLLTTSKYSMKAQLKNLPGAGFGMAANQFIFLERKIDEDKCRLTEAIEYYSEVGGTYQILIFPEGTDKTNYTTKKSNEYAKKNGLKELSYLLYPRSAGISFLIEKMRECNYISCVYDITIAYPDNIVQNEVELVFKGKVPKRVHFDIRRIDISKVPKNPNEMANWINSLWIAKEAKLADFYSKPKEKRLFNVADDGFIWDEQDEPLHKSVMLFSFIFWMFVVGIWLYHLTFLRLVQMGVPLYLAVVLIIGCCYGGIDRMVLYKWNKHRYDRTVGGG